MLAPKSKLSPSLPATRHLMGSTDSTGSLVFQSFFWTMCSPFLRRQICLPNLPADMSTGKTGIYVYRHFGFANTGPVYMSTELTGRYVYRHFGFANTGPVYMSTELTGRYVYRENRYICLPNKTPRSTRVFCAGWLQRHKKTATVACGGAIRTATTPSSIFY